MLESNTDDRPSSACIHSDQFVSVRSKRWVSLSLSGLAPKNSKRKKKTVNPIAVFPNAMACLSLPQNVPNAAGRSKNVFLSHLPHPPPRRLCKISPPITTLPPPRPLAHLEPLLHPPAILQPIIPTVCHARPKHQPTRPFFIAIGAARNRATVADDAAGAATRRRQSITIRGL